MKSREYGTKKLVTVAMLTALAMAAMLLIRVDVSFLTFEPKDVVITIGGMLYGPLTALLMSTSVALIEMITVSTTGFIGFIMNLLSSASFCCTAALFYKRKRTLGSAYLGLAVGILMSTSLMLLWNYFLTPIYLKVPQEAVLSMMLPLLLPFNLIKGGINATATGLLYKPIATALRKTGLMPKPQCPPKGETDKAKKILVWIAAAIVFALLLLALFFLISKQPVSA